MNEWDKEREHLKEVIPVIKRQMAEAQDIVRNRKDVVMDFRRHFWDDLTLNFDTPEDLLETASDLNQHTLMLKRDEISYAKALNSLRKLEKQLPSPYFGRIDFVESGSEEGRGVSCYVGIQALIDEMTGEPLIFDWRAPVSQLFYDFAPGPAEYETPEGAVCGEVTLKRQYVIRHGQLENMFDTGIQIVDEMLQQMLGKNADDKMKSIVTTIQKEQNEIIRDDRFPLLIVQGTAGSGKTSVALQRVAYLLYKYRESLTAEQMLLFSPNPLFNDYVSTVLPELGEQNMRQTTFQEYLEHRLGAVGKLEDAYDQLEGLLLMKDEAARTVRQNGIRFKASAAFARIIRRYVEMLQSDGLWFKDFVARDRLALSGAKLGEIFYRKDSHLAVSRRLEKLREWIEGELEDKQQEFTRDYYRKLMKVPQYIGTEPELKQQAKRTMKKRFAPLHRMAEELSFLDVVDTYRRLFADPVVFPRAASVEEANIPSGWEEIARQTAERLAERIIPYEDSVPLLYFKELLEGFRVFLGIRHVIVDEAQDYSPFHYELLNRMFPRSRMTLLGDWNQGIFPHAGEESLDAVRSLYGEGQSHRYRLFKSYRSTREIVDFTSSLLPAGEPVESFNRHGEKVGFIRVSDQEELAECIVRQIQVMREAGAKSLAVICKTAEESKQVHDRLSRRLEAVLITKHTRTFVSGLLVLPAYLAKGLEFDGVIVHDAGAAAYGRESERKLLYTACTRAMHRLCLIYTGELSPLIGREARGLALSADFHI